MTKFLALISFLATPVVIYLVFGWQGVAASFLALMVYAFLDFRRFRKKDKWQNSPLNLALRRFGQYNFSLANQLGENAKLKPESVIPEHFSEEQKEEILRINSEYDQLLSKLYAAVDEFEENLKIKKGTGVSGEEILLIVERMKDAAHNVKIEYSSEYAELHKRSLFFEKLVSKLNFGQDIRGDDIWGQPQKVLNGRRFHLQGKSLDILNLDNYSSESFYITVGSHKLDIAEFIPDRLEDCVSKVRGLSA